MSLASELVRQTGRPSWYHSHDARQSAGPKVVLLLLEYGATYTQGPPQGPRQLCLHLVLGT